MTRLITRHRPTAADAAAVRHVLALMGLNARVRRYDSNLRVCLPENCTDADRALATETLASADFRGPLGDAPNWSRGYQAMVWKVFA